MSEVFGMLVDWFIIQNKIVSAHGSRSWFTVCMFNGGNLRGIHVLQVYAGGSLRCIACILCSTLCPAHALQITSGISITSGNRIAVCWQVCYSRCITCGWCDITCPTSACEQSGYYFQLWYTSTCATLGLYWLVFMFVVFGVYIVLSFMFCVVLYACSF